MNHVKVYRKKTILLVHNYYKQPGGEDTVFRNEKAMLESHGHKVYEYTRSNLEMNNMGIIEKCMVPFNAVFSLKTYRDIKHIIKKKKIEIVHVHNTLSLISPSVYYAAISMGVPVYQTMHNFRMLCPGATFYRNGKVCEDCANIGLGCSLSHKCYRGSFVQTLISALTLKIHRMTGIYKKVNYICLTEFNCNKLLKLNKNGKKIIDESKVYIKPNFTKIEMYEDNFTEYDALIDKCEIVAKDYYIFIGRLEAIKGIKMIVKAFKESGKTLVVLGTGDQEGLIKRYVEKYKLRNIKLLGYKRGDDFDKFFSNAKALVIGSQWYETFGMTVIEAYSRGVPVIVGDIGNIGDIVVDGETGYKYTYNNFKALIKCLERFERLDYTSMLRMANNAKIVFSSKYSEHSNYQILSGIYTEKIY